MIKRVFLLHRRMIVAAAALTIAMQGFGIIAFDLLGLKSGRELFGNVITWGALILFTALPFLAAWRSDRDPPSPLLPSRPSALVTGAIVNGIFGSVSLGVGFIDIAIRVLSTGWSQESFVLLVGTLAGFLLLIPLGGWLGWIAGRLARMIKTRRRKASLTDRTPEGT